MRHYAKDALNHTMGAAAAKVALGNANIKAEDIDLIIASTSTPDYFHPSLACLIQREIGAKCGAFDVSAACAGFIYALDTARSFLCTGKYKTILVAASEKLSNQTDYTDRNTCVLFGDGAGAVIIQASDGLYESYLGAQGDDITNAFIQCPVNYDNKTKPYITMDGRGVYKFAADIMPYSVNEALKLANKTADDVTLLIPHQANIRIIEKAAEKIGIPMERVFVNVGKYGNISSACIPVALSESIGGFKRGDIIALTGFGAGLSYGAIVFEV